MHLSAYLCLFFGKFSLCVKDMCSSSCT